MYLFAINLKTTVQIFIQFSTIARVIPDEGFSIRIISLSFVKTDDIAMILVIKISVQSRDGLLCIFIYKNCLFKAIR